MKTIHSKQAIEHKKPKWSLFFGSLLATFLLMAGTSSFAQERENVSVNALEDFNDSDLNQDQQWDREEFDARLKEEGLFEDWDVDKDQLLSEEEVEEGLGKLQERIYEVKEHVIGNYAIVEVNEDDSVNLAGPANPRLNLDLIDDWDLDNDGYYSEAEMSTGLFDHWDEDLNGALEYDEYSATFFTENYED